jgi:diacylglycerol kinase family enzyme
MQRSIEVILNAKSGSQKAGETREVIAKVLRECGRSFHISTATGDDLCDLAEEKAASECEILVAGGGDGTICCVAAAALKHGKTLGVIPLGTFNYFARNLQIPLAPDEAVKVIIAGHTVRASVLDLNGRLILNNASIGIHPAVLLKRRQIYRRWGRNQASAYVSVALTAFQPPPRLRVRIETEKGELVRETPLVMVCSNAFQMDAFGLAGKECLNCEKFALYVARMGGRLTIPRLGLRTLLRRLRAGVDYDVICTSDVTIETLRQRRFRAAVDGDLERLESPLRFTIGQNDLCVIAPRAQLEA